MEHLPHYSNLEAYCKGINISPPKHELYDIRSFEENMSTVHKQMPPFKHEFYAIALKVEGGGFASAGLHNTRNLEATIFFNSPYQIIHWDISPNWQGYYVIFLEEFYRQNWHRKRITEAFPFLLGDNSFPLAVSASEIEIFKKTFDNIYFEHQEGKAHKEEIIQRYIEILLLMTSRLYDKSPHAKSMTTHQRDKDLDIVSRFKALIESSFYPGKDHGQESPHLVKFYADKIGIHPNHLNAIVKRITEHSALDLIQTHLLGLAKSRLLNSGASVKEIAYGLYFNYPNHFSSFFKKQTGLSPNSFRQQ